MLEVSGEITIQINDRTAFVFSAYTLEGFLFRALIPALGFLLAVAVGWLNVAGDRDWWAVGAGTSSTSSPVIVIGAAPGTVVDITERFVGYLLALVGSVVDILLGAACVLGDALLSSS